MRVHRTAMITETHLLLSVASPVEGFMAVSGSESVSKSGEYQTQVGIDSDSESDSDPDPLEMSQPVII